jgi:hypothetical protein
MKAASGMQKRIFVDGDGKILRLKNDVEIGALPAPVKATVDANSAGTKFMRSTKVTHDGTTEYEVELDASGHSRELLLDPAGTLERLEEVVDLASVPPKVKAEIEKTVGKHQLLKVEASTESGKATTYEAQFDADGHKAEVTFSAEGKVLERE